MNESRLKAIFRVLGVVLGVAKTIAARNSFGPDSRSYLEIARAYLRHDWAMAINAYWSPLYSWLSAALLSVVHPSWRSEIPLTHAMNFVLFLLAIAAFEFFWSGIRRSASGVHNLVLWIFGYSLFLWLTLGFLASAGPDLCVCAMVYLIAGLVLRIKDGAATKHFIWLGFALAVGYFAKAVLFPMAFVFLAVLLIVRMSPKKTAWSALIFASIAAPQILLLSHAKGRFTFGDSGALNLTWSNYNVPDRNWQGEPAGNGVPAHPTRQVYEHPAVFEFNGPINASYPPWRDPSYWNEGLRFHFVPNIVMRHALHNTAQILSYFLHPRIWVMAMLILVALSTRKSLAGIAAHWLLVVPALAAFTMYSLTFALFRFMPAWEVLVWAAFLFGLRIRPNLSQRFLLWLGGITATLMLLSSANGIRAEFAYRHDDVTPDYRIVEELQDLGIHAGQKVAAVGFDNDANWAYLSRLFVVAEIDLDQTCEFWSAAPAVQQKVLARFKEAGASLVVARVDGGMKSTDYDVAPDMAACTHPGAGWHNLPDSDLVYFLH